MNLYTNSTRGSLIRRRLAFSILRINRLATFPLIIGLFWRIVRIFREDLGYPHSPDIGFWWSSVIMFSTVAIIGIISISASTRLLNNHQIHEALEPRFNAWHDNKHVITKIGGFALSLACYLSAIMVQLLSLFGINYEIGNIMFVHDFVADYFRNYHYIERLNHLALCGIIAGLFCALSTYICWHHLKPSQPQEEIA